MTASGVNNAWVAGDEYISFANVPTDGSGNIVITVNNPPNPGYLAGLQIYQVPPTGLINVALGAVATGQTVYTGGGPVVGQANDYWNAVSLAASGTTAYPPLNSGPLNDSSGQPTGVSVQVGTSGGPSQTWNNDSGGVGLGLLVQNYVQIWGNDSIEFHGLDNTKSYNVYCLGAPWAGSVCEFSVGGVTNTIVSTNSWIAPWRENENFVFFTNVPTDGSGNLVINVGGDGIIPQQFCGFQLQPVPVTLVTQPQSQVVPPGSSVNLSVAASGGSGTPTYQWQQNVSGNYVNLADGGNVRGSATSTLTLFNVQATNAATYQAVITVGQVVTNSNPATITIQSGVLTNKLTADTTTVFRNPFMGWVIYPFENGGVDINPLTSAEFWEQCDATLCPYASTCYIRVLWSDLEPQEGVYAWNSDTNFIALVQGAWSRGMRVAFRVYVNSADVPQQATPQWAFNGGVPIASQDNDGPSPDITSSIFQQKYATFINAFGAYFNDPSKTSWVDASTFGNWGEMNVNNQTLNTAQLQQTMTWVCNTYSNAFTRVPTAMNFPGGTWSVAQLKSWCFNTGCTAIRRDGVCGVYGDVTTSQQSSIQSLWPGIPFIAENYFHDPTDVQKQACLAQSLYLHANLLDLHQPWNAISWLQDEPQLVKMFNLYGGYRFSVGTVTYPGTIQASSNVVLQATVQNWGVGVLPNGLKPWNYKYKFAYALLSTNGNPVATIVDTAPADDPSNWTNGTAYNPPLSSGIPVDLMANYWQTNSKTYTLKVTNNFGAVAPGNYYLGVAVVDTSNTNHVDISLAVTAPRASSGWNLVGPVIVGTPPAITAQPQSQIVPQGATVQMNVGASGTPAPTYRWNKNSVNLNDGATGNGSTFTGSASNLLTLVNAQAADSGNYIVGVTNSAGGTNSGAAQLLVVAPATAGQAPRLTNSLSGVRFGLTFTALPGYRYLVQRSTNLSSAHWVTLTNLPPSFTGLLFNWSDGLTSPAAYYRSYMTNQ